MNTIFFDGLKRAGISAGVLAVSFTAAVLMSGCTVWGSSEGKGILYSAAAATDQQETIPDLSGIIARDTVTVSARGRVYAVPDQAELHFGIRTQAETATEAQEENSSKVDAVIEVLQKNGISEKDIQTTTYDISPQYDWNTGDGTHVIGYSVYSALSVRDVEIDDVGKLISACTEAGAGEFNGISYSCTSYEELYAEALKEAVIASKDKASVLAQAAGRTLGEVKMISEGYQDMTYANRTTKAVYEAAVSVEEDSVGSASLLPGEAEISATVTVTYELE